jgi:hypothetical protein
MVELQCLAIVLATKKCRLYLAGLPTYTVVTDHRPLLPILNYYTLDRVENVRLVRYKTALSGYQFKVTWRKGTEHCVPDALSRAPTHDPTQENDDKEKEVHLMRQATIRVAATSSDEEDERLCNPVVEQMRVADKADNNYRDLVLAVEESIMTKRTKLYKNTLPEDGLILYRQRLALPKACRKDVIVRLHASHQGIDRTKRRARHTVYWPGITSDVTNAVESCQHCQEQLPSQIKEPLKRDPMPTRVFESTSADLFSFGGKMYMVYADRLSGFPFMKEWRKDPNASEALKEVRRHFVHMGVPVQMRTVCGQGVPRLLE